MQNYEITCLIPCEYVLKFAFKNFDLNKRNVTTLASYPENYNPRDKFTIR
jgi:hypothetical protein